MENPYSDMTTEQLQDAIDRLEDSNPHDQLPDHYDLLVAARNAKEK